MSQYSTRELEEAYKIAAVIVKRYGEKYLPVFKRMHDEIEQAKADNSFKQIALQVAAEVNK